MNLFSGNLKPCFTAFGSCNRALQPVLSDQAFLQLYFLAEPVFFVLYLSDIIVHLALGWPGSYQTLCLRRPSSIAPMPPSLVFQPNLTGYICSIPPLSHFLWSSCHNPRTSCPPINKVGSGMLIILRRRPSKASKCRFRHHHYHHHHHCHCHCHGHHHFHAIAIVIVIVIVDS